MNEGRPEANRVIRDLLRFVDEAAELAGRGREAFDGDHMLRLAGIAIVTRFGEAAGRVPEAVRLQHPTVPWRSIVGMRNRLVHDYDIVDYDLVWEAIARELPKVGDVIAPGR